MEDPKEKGEGFLAESHITGKLPTPSGEKIDPLQYFSDYKREMQEFTAETQHLFPKKPGVTTGSALLSYEHEPQPFMFEACKYFREYVVSGKKINKALVLNENLASVKARKSLTSWKSVSPKYALYQFKPYQMKEKGSMKEIIFQVKIYKPFFAKGRQEDIKIQQELWLKGSSTLKNLRDALVCHLDYCGLEEVSEYPPSTWRTELPTLKEAQLKYPSYFFFINRTFYTSSDDGVMEARDFLERHNFGKKFISEPIDTRLQDITLEIGRPYVYQHLGQCEHVLVVSDIRLETKHDPQFLFFVKFWRNCGFGHLRKTAIECKLIGAEPRKSIIIADFNIDTSFEKTGHDPQKKPVPFVNNDVRPRWTAGSEKFTP